VQCSAVGCRQSKERAGEEIEAGHFETMSHRQLHDYTSTSEDSAEPSSTPHHTMSCYSMLFHVTDTSCLIS
jgi:hypothetical protein